MVLNSKLFFMEFVVSSLSIYESPVPNTAQDPTKDTCIVLKFQDVEMEICAKDYGLTLADFQDRVKAGNNCLFTLKPMGMELTISAFKKSENGVKQLIGSTTKNVEQIFETIAGSFDTNINDIEENRGRPSGFSVRGVTSVGQPNNSPPVSKTIKNMYRLQDLQGNVTSVLEALLRVTCFGPSILTPFRMGGENKMVPIAMDNAGTEEKCPFGCKNLTNSCENPQSDSGFNCEDVLQTAPPGSKTDLCEETPYTEYTAEINGNALIIRVPKGANLETKFEKDQISKSKDKTFIESDRSTHCRCLEDSNLPYAKNTCVLPPIHGNLKYPTINVCKNDPMSHNVRHICMQCDLSIQPTNPEESANKAVQNIKSGIEVCRKGWHDHNTDVFVLRLGKRSDDAQTSGQHGIELELRTPKNPDSQEKFKVTKQVQVYEEEFEDAAGIKSKTETVPKKKPAAGGTKDKKGAKTKSPKKK